MKILIYLVIIYSIISDLAAQEIKLHKTQPTTEDTLAFLRKTPLAWQVGLALTNSIPQQEFQRNLGHCGFGFTIDASNKLLELPVSFGGRFDLLFYDLKSRVFDNTYESRVYHDTISATSLIIPLDIFLKFQSEMGIFSPYAEVFFGPTFFSTHSSFDPEYGESQSDGHFNVSWNWGISGGLMIRVAEFFNMPDSYKSLYLNTNLRYAFGGISYYYTADMNYSGQVQFKQYRSETSMINFSMGIIFRF